MARVVTDDLSAWTCGNHRYEPLTVNSDRDLRPKGKRLANQGGPGSFSAPRRSAHTGVLPRRPLRVRQAAACRASGIYRAWASGLIFVDL